jgi:hypothetical protein
LLAIEQHPARLAITAKYDRTHEVIAKSRQLASGGTELLPAELFEEIEEEILDVLVGPFVVTLKPRDQKITALPKDLRQFVIIGMEAHGAMLTRLCQADGPDQSGRHCFIQ